MSRGHLIDLLHRLTPVVVSLSLLSGTVLFGSMTPKSVFAAGPEPVIEWSRTFGSPNQDAAYSVQQTSDGGFIVAGQTYSYGVGGGDAWLIKADSSGNEQWNKTFGGPGCDAAWSVRQTSDGGFIVAGYTGSYGAGDFDAWLIKTDSNGNEQWSKTFGGPMRDCFYSVQQTSDGGFIVAGFTGSYGAGGLDAWLIKTDSNGNEQWSKTFGGLANDAAWSVQQTSDGGFIFAGVTGATGYDPFSGGDAWLVKTDSGGNEQWSTTFGGPGSDAHSVQQTSDGGFIVGGTYGANGGDVWLIKTDSEGNEQWNKTFGGPYEDSAWSVQQTSDGGFIVAGTDSFGGPENGNPWLIKTDSVGNEQWDKIFHGPSWDNAHSVQQTSDGGFIVAGYYTGSSMDVWLTKLSGTNLVPIQPTNVSPSNGATGITLTPTLQSSAFSDPDAGDTHAASQWQVRTGSGNYSTPVLGVTSNTALTSFTVPSGNLGYDTTYYWHVRYQDNHGAWSSYSTETSFTTTSTTPPTYNTPVGSSVTVPVNGGTLTFDNVTVAGNTTMTSQQGNPGGEIPSGFRVRGNFVDIVTTATYSGPITVGIPYDPSTPNPQNLKLFHWVGHWDDVTTSVDTTNHIVYGEVTSFSWFFIGGEWVWVDEGTHNAPVFPSMWIGIGAALGAGMVAYFVRRRLLPR